MTKDQEEIEGLLARRIGLDPVAVGPHLVLRAARRRMAELGLGDLGGYTAHLAGSEPELQALIEEVVVPESWFFRDERPFRWLEEYVRSRWLNDPARPPLRVLSVPCAGGEEPYSIAMTLWDLGLPPRRFSIDAVDVSARRLAVARRGIYTANAFRGSRPGGGDRCAKHFRADPQGYELDPAIRATVRFFQANVLDPRLLEDSPPYDVVFCRNLLIYLDTRARACVLAVLDRLVAAGGALLIGHADRLEPSGAPPRFVAVDEPGCFAYRKRAVDGRTARASLEPPRPLLSLVAPIGGGTIREPVITDGSPVTLVGPERGAPTTAADPSGAAEPAASLLDQAAELANQGRTAEAIAACERHIRLKGPGASAFYLLGMIYQSAGDRRRAEDCFHKTVYLDPKHAEALLALALLAERRGDRDAADGFRRRARKIAAIPPERGESR